MITREEFDEQRALSFHDLTVRAHSASMLVKEDVSLKEMPDLGTQATRCVQASLLAEVR